MGSIDLETRNGTLIIMQLKLHLLSLSLCSVLVISKALKKQKRQRSNYYINLLNNISWGRNPVAESAPTAQSKRKENQQKLEAYQNFYNINITKSKKGKLTKE